MRKTMLAVVSWALCLMLIVPLWAMADSDEGPVLTGTNEIGVLPGSTFHSAFAVAISGAEAGVSSQIDLKLGEETATVEATGHDTAITTMPVQLDADAQITASVIAIPETPVGTVKMVDAAPYLSGDFPRQLNSKWTQGNVTPSVPIAFRGADLKLDEQTGIASISLNKSLDIVIAYSGSGAVKGHLEAVRVSPYGANGIQMKMPSQLWLKAKTTVSKNKRAVKFSFPVRELIRLGSGYHRFVVESGAKGKYAGFGPVTLATVNLLEVKQPPINHFSSIYMLPPTLRLAERRNYTPMVFAKNGGGSFPMLSYSTDNPSVIDVSWSGGIITKKPGAATVWVKGDKKETCKVTVVPNRFEAKYPLMLKGTPGLYTSTKRMYYEKKSMKVEVFVYNRTGAPITGLDSSMLQINCQSRWDFQDGEYVLTNGGLNEGDLQFSWPIERITFNKPLQDGAYKVYKLTITDAMIEGVEWRPFDFVTENCRAIIRGTDQSGNRIVPLASWTTYATPIKGAKAKSAGMVDARILGIR